MEHEINVQLVQRLEQTREKVMKLKQKGCYVELQRDEIRNMYSEETNIMIHKVRRMNDELQNYKIINFGLREHIKKVHS
jgi:hypothetical protein